MALSTKNAYRHFINESLHALLLTTKITEFTVMIKHSSNTKTTG